MTRRNYPLTALRSFEAAARHLSFVKAAEELHVTPGAISQQIKTLEEYLDAQLFERQPNKLLLTDTAKRLLPRLSDGFLQLDQAIEQIVGDEGREELSISAAPMFTAKWLSPRLEKFNSAYSNINLHISSSLRIVDFHRESVDAAIRFSPNDYPGLKKIELFEEHITPMCSPSLIKEKGKLEKIEDLKSFTLIHDDSIETFLGKPGWQFWFEQSGYTDINFDLGPHFSEPDHAVQSAIDGAGIVLGRISLSEDDLATNRLVAPYAQRIPLGGRYTLVYPESYAHRKKIKYFQEWLLGEI